MRLFVPFLLIFHLLYLSLPSTALDKHTADVDSKASLADVVGSIIAEAGAWASPQPPPSDFWEKVEEYEQVLREQVSDLLKSAEATFKSTAFADIAHAMENVVHVTATFRDNIKDALDAHDITPDMLTKELEAIFMEAVHDLGNNPPPSKAPSHAERCKVVNRVLDDIELALTNLLTHYGVEADAVKTFVDALRPYICALVSAVGDINEQCPELLPALTFSVAVLLIPESWILRPFLSIFGFGPGGPVKGSIAAWMQRFFWGAAVDAGSWFSWLQAAGMGGTSKWAGPVIKAPIIIASLSTLAICFRRGWVAE